MTFQAGQPFLVGTKKLMDLFFNAMFITLFVAIKISIPLSVRTTSDNAEGICPRKYSF